MHRIPALCILSLLDPDERFHRLVRPALSLRHPQPRVFSQIRLFPRRSHLNCRGISRRRRKSHRTGSSMASILSTVASLRATLPYLSCLALNFPRSFWPRFGESTIRASSRWTQIDKIRFRRDLADMHGDGKLSKDGFAVALHLINNKLAGKEVPNTLPPSLIPPSARKPTQSSPFPSLGAPQQAPPQSESHGTLLDQCRSVLTHRP